MERTRLHQLGDILTIAILSVLAGGNGWEDMEYRFSKVTRDLISKTYHPKYGRAMTDD